MTVLRGGRRERVCDESDDGEGAGEVDAAPDADAGTVMRSSGRGRRAEGGPALRWPLTAREDPLKALSFFRLSYKASDIHTRSGT